MFVSDVTYRELENKHLEMECLGKRICLLILVSYLTITAKKLIIYKYKMVENVFFLFSSRGLNVGFPQVKNMIYYLLWSYRAALLSILM